MAKRYKSKKITDPVIKDVFKDWLPEGAVLYQHPRLPEVVMKSEGYIFTVTDINKSSKDVQNALINVVEGALKLNPPDACVELDIKGMDNSTIEDIRTCLLSLYIGIEDEKTGNYCDCSFLVESIKTTKDKLILQLIPSHIMSIQANLELCKIDGEGWNYFLLAIGIAFEAFKGLLEGQHNDQRTD